MALSSWPSQLTNSFRTKLTSVYFAKESLEGKYSMAQLRDYCNQWNTHQVSFLLQWTPRENRQEGGEYNAVKVTPLA